MALWRSKIFHAESCTTKFLYETIQIFVCVSNRLTPFAIAWGDEGREITKHLMLSKDLALSINGSTTGLS